MALTATAIGAISAAAIGAGAGIISGGVNAGMVSKDQKFNKEFANKQFAYQQELNNILMQREDNAVQRRVADLEEAGLSRLNAIGQGASASPMSVGGSQVTPRQQIDYGASQISALGNSLADIELKSANARLTEQNILTDIERMKNETQDTKLKEELTKYQEKLLERLIHDYGIDKARGTKENETTSQLLNNIKDSSANADRHSRDTPDRREKAREEAKQNEYINNMIIKEFAKNTKLRDIVNKFYDEIPGNTFAKKMMHVEMLYSKEFSRKTFNRATGQNW